MYIVKNDIIYFDLLSSVMLNSPHRLADTVLWNVSLSFRHRGLASFEAFFCLLNPYFLFGFTCCWVNCCCITLIKFPSQKKVTLSWVHWTTRKRSISCLRFYLKETLRTERTDSVLERALEKEEDFDWELLLKWQTGPADCLIGLCSVCIAGTQRIYII